MTDKVAQADVLAVRNTGWTSRIIRLGAALRDQPNLDNHIVVAHHYDAAGTLWGIEGRPGGVGWVDCRGYLANPYTVTNAGQPKTNAQRNLVCSEAVALLKTPYDWTAIERDGMVAIGAQDLWGDRGWTADGSPPAHVVCSSFADWLYVKAGLAAPRLAGSMRETTPADWTRFILTRAWQTA